MIGDRIKELREKKGLTLTELADLAGVSKSYLSHIERKLQNNPSLQMLSKISVPLETKVQYLLTDQQAPKEDVFDEEWMALLHKAIEDGMSKEDFVRLSERIRMQ
ncbi:XRE family transcriptional regulator [Paenibacillus mendelii]|uniref:Helix-turn-helix domain-containing protein n=1 Tax=Paenibacillus mendelii TaxID=206163 RepID=A0ABV6JJG7_9BACL|nr:XRE family transcriptional regulator [Paenibacillus mendelii]MCQ6558993.1 helix-turn-helix domain-containing protein [Paenibacillus mendelii]